jgi:hypothetical protein
MSSIGLAACAALATAALVVPATASAKDEAATAAAIGTQPAASTAAGASAPCAGTSDMAHRAGRLVTQARTVAGESAAAARRLPA